jgi:ligand-binding SRPBCC domain-containing protein
MPTFEKRSFVRATPEQVFAFHESPDALMRLIPPWERVRIVEKTGRGLEVGVRVVLEMSLGPIRQQWVAEHVAYAPPKMFKDVQLSGPFARWEHLHLFEAVPGGTELIDRIDYELPFGLLGSLGEPFVRRKIVRMFDHRHEVTREACEAAS